MRESLRPGDETLRLAVNQRIDAVCYCFEKAWKEGKQPRLEDYLTDFAPEELPSLLSELVPLDADCRRRRGENPRRDEYLARFPVLDPDCLTDASAASTVSQGGPAAEPARPTDGIRYRALRPHARGGLGEVFVAEDCELHREVALKEILPQHAADPRVRSRFLVEAEITGNLEHPGVVPVYGLGAYPDGRPFYAMRFIKGESLKDAIRRFHDADTPGRDPSKRSLAMRQLLRRFIDMCNAVAYAHSRGVVHRDLKPANVMLGKYGETLVVDWGLAKAVGRQATNGLTEVDAEASIRPSFGSQVDPTQLGMAIGTPTYMSPEQAGATPAEAGPASDIYSLGGTLYTLLTGRTPVEGAEVGAVLLQVHRGEIPPPRQVKKGVPVALEAVCRKAMALRPEDRYATALALAADVEGWLADEPVSAYREPWRARVWRWLRRHRTLAASAAAALVVLLIAMTAGLVVVKGEQQQTQAAWAAEAKRRQQARQALDAMSSKVIDEWLAKQKQLTPEHRAFLEQALAFYEQFATDTGKDEAGCAGVAAAYFRVGGIQRRLGRMADAEMAYERSRDLYKQMAADFPNVPQYRADLAGSHHDLGSLRRATGQLQEAEVAYREALALKKQLAADFPTVPQYRQRVARCHSTFGSLLHATGRPQEAEVAYGEALALAKQLAADFPNVPEHRHELAISHNNLGALFHRTGRPQDAEAAYRETLALRKQLAVDFPKVPEHRQELAGTHHNLALLFRDIGRPQDAEAASREALALEKELVVDFPSLPQYRENLAGTHNNLGILLGKNGRPQDAEAAFRVALALYKELAADFPNQPKNRQDLAASHNNLGLLLRATGRLQDAEAAFGEALRLQKQLAVDFPMVPDLQYSLAGTLDNLAGLRYGRKDVDEARQLLQQSVAHFQAALKANPRDPVYRESWRNNRQLLTAVLVDLGDHVAAVETAAQLREAAVEPMEDCYNAACFLARCVMLAEEDSKISETHRKELAHSYADRAMTSLRQAVEHGYKDVTHMKQDQDLDALRDRSDFKKLLAEMEDR